MKNRLYPLKFIPIFKEKIWGGKKLETFLKKDSKGNNIGESWEISDVEDNCSVVANGKLKGKNLQEVLVSHKEKLVGEQVYKRFGDKFPLLIKFIDAKENLSVQLHPDDILAKERHDSFGKTEMWYIVQADENSEIIVGFKDGITKKDYREKLKTKKLEEILNFETVKPGDTFFIKPGLIHAIGKGVLLAEIQQTSDITYRVYDWDRKDQQGKERELHTHLAIDAIDFNTNQDFKIEYSSLKNQANSLVEHSYFKTSFIPLTKKINLDYSAIDSFVIFMGIDGDIEIEATNEEEAYHERLKAGETILIPACFNKVTLEGNNSKLLQVTI